MDLLFRLAESEDPATRALATEQCERLMAGVLGAIGVSEDPVVAAPGPSGASARPCAATREAAAAAEAERKRKADAEDRAMRALDFADLKKTTATAAAAAAEFARAATQEAAAAAAAEGRARAVVDKMVGYHKRVALASLVAGAEAAALAAEEAAAAAAAAAETAKGQVPLIGLEERACDVAHEKANPLVAVAHRDHDEWLGCCRDASAALQEWEALHKGGHAATAAYGMAREAYTHAVALRTAAGKAYELSRKAANEELYTAGKASDAAGDAEYRAEEAAKDAEGFAKAAETAAEEARAVETATRVAAAAAAAEAPRWKRKREARGERGEGDEGDAKRPRRG
jgi:hypothetical protein